MQKDLEIKYENPNEKSALTKKKLFQITLWNYFRQWFYEVEAIGRGR